MPRTTSLRAVAALCLVGIAVATPAPAGARSERGQLTYSCATAAEGHESQPATYPFVTALQLDVPPAVHPGDTVRLAGTFSVQFPEELRSLAADYFTYIQAVSDTLTIPVSVGGRTTVLRASRLDSGKVSTKNQPLILRGAVSASAFRIPEGATGDLRIQLPANGTAKSNIDGSPVAFNAEALLSGGIVSTFYERYTYKAACTAPGGADRTVATLPVEPRRVGVAAATPAGSAPEDQAPAASDGQGAPTAPSDGVATDFGSAASPTTDGGRPQAVSANADRATSAPSPGSRTSAAVPNTATNGVRVPGWALLAAAVVVMLPAVAVAAWSHHRVRMVRARLEG